MTTDDIYAAVASDVEFRGAVTAVNPMYPPDSYHFNAIAKAAVDAVAPLLIAQGRREAALAIRAFADKYEHHTANPSHDSQVAMREWRRAAQLVDDLDTRITAWEVEIGGSLST